MNARIEQTIISPRSRINDGTQGPQVTQKERETKICLF